MDIQRIAIIFGLAVTAYMLVLAWNDDYGSNSARPAEPAVVNQDSTQPDSLLPVPVTPSVEGDIVPVIEDRPIVSRQEAVLSEDLFIHVVTDVLDLTIDLRGGDITSVTLPKYPADLATPLIPFQLVSPRNGYSAQSGLIGPNGIDKSGNRPVFRSSASRFEMGTADELSVVLTLDSHQGLTVRKRFSLRRADYLVDVNYEIDNKSDGQATVAFFSQIKRDGQPPADEEVNSMGLKPYVGGATRAKDELYKKLSFEDIEEEPFKEKVDGGYIAMVQHYFVSAWVPEKGREYTYQARKLADQDIYLLGFTSPLLTIPVGQTLVTGAQFYVGPKDQYRLEEIAEGLDLTVDYGFLWWLAQPLFHLLTFIHSIFGNWGVAIILLTVIVKTLLYPLSAASFKSMAKMRKLQPEMARLKERFGDDKQQFSQAMMELYKKEGANPLGGCLPILLQMPVFLALYWTLMESVELRQAPFALWINDLSVMDPYFVLPILMGGSMFLTQMMQPEPPDPVQAKVFKMMPIMFTFFFLWFPSGLVLYWLVNNILSVLQQWYVTRQIDKGT